MKKKNINNLLWAAFALLLIAGCGFPSGSIGTSATTTPTGFAVDLFCNGAACGEDVAADAIIGVKITPAVEASAFTTVLSCDGVDYPLTLAGQEAVEDSILFNFTHATIPQVRPCTLAVTFVDAAKSLYGDPKTPATADFTIACDPTGSDDFSYAPTLEKCWMPALVELAASQQGGINQGGVVDVGGKAAFSVTKAPAAEAFTMKTTWDELLDAGVVAEIGDGALQISATTGTDLAQKIVIIYKIIDKPGMPSVMAQMFDSGFDLRPELDKNNQPIPGSYTTNESYGVIVGDNTVLDEVCTFQINAKALPSSMGGPEGQAEVPMFFGVENWTGFKLLSMQQAIQQAVMMNGSITEGGCGFETTDSPAQLQTKYMERTSAVKQSVPVNCTYEEESSWIAGISGGAEAREYRSGTAFEMSDYLWQGKPAQTTTVASDYFDPSNGTIVGFMYQSVDSSGAMVKGGTPSTFVPFTLRIEDVKIE